MTKNHASCNSFATIILFNQVFRMTLYRNLTSVLTTVLFISGCSHAHYGEDVVFSHSLPPPAQINTCNCEQPVNQEEEIAITVYFATDNYALNEQAITSLESFVKAINHRKVIEMSIVGHTDSRASNQYNDQLSQRRAQSVIDYLKGKGIDSPDSQISWQGENMPAADNQSDTGMAKNRRSVVTARLIGS